LKADPAGSAFVLRADGTAFLVFSSFLKEGSEELLSENIFSYTDNEFAFANSYFYAPPQSGERADLCGEFMKTAKIRARTL